MTDEHSLDPVGNYLYTKQTHRRWVGKKQLKILKDKKPVTLRLYMPNELDLLFRHTGFETIGFYGDFDGHRLSQKHHERLIAVAQKE